MGLDAESGVQDGLRLLIVSADFPFPPRWGFAMRVYQLARKLASRHRVTLLSYALPSDDVNVVRLREELPVEVVRRGQTSRAGKRTRQIMSMAAGNPAVHHAVVSSKMQEAIDALCGAHAYDFVQLESSLLCAFRFPPGTRLILDEHNIEYEVFQRMREGERSLARRSFYRLEHARFRRFEQRWWRQVAGCAVTSEREARIVNEHAPGTPVAVVPNGVDLEYFHPSPDRPELNTVVFNALLQYRPNLDAAYHLVDVVWPLVVRQFRDARLTIVGRGDADDLRRLERRNVVVTGEVPDVRPYLERAAVVAVPIRMGGGTRLKVLEGLAMGKAMVSTTLGCEGIRVRDGEHLLIADSAEDFASSLGRLLADPESGRALGLAGRRLMEAEYSWDASAERLDGLYRQLLPQAVPDGERRPLVTQPVALGAGDV